MADQKRREEAGPGGQPGTTTDPASQAPAALSEHQFPQSRAGGPAQPGRGRGVTASRAGRSTSRPGARPGSRRWW
jgi:hypothetical protein